MKERKTCLIGITQVKFISFYFQNYSLHYSDLQFSINAFVLLYRQLIRSWGTMPFAKLNPPGRWHNWLLWPLLFQAESGRSRPAPSLQCPRQPSISCFCVTLACHLELCEPVFSSAVTGTQTFRIPNTVLIVRNLIAEMEWVEGGGAVLGSRQSGVKGFPLFAGVHPALVPQHQESGLSSAVQTFLDWVPFVCFAVCRTSKIFYRDLIIPVCCDKAM